MYFSCGMICRSHPRAQYVVNPATLRLIAQIEHQSRFLLALGNLIQQVSVVHLQPRRSPTSRATVAPAAPGLAGNCASLYPLAVTVRLLAAGRRGRPPPATAPRYASFVQRTRRSGCFDELYCSWHPPTEKRKRTGRKDPLTIHYIHPVRKKLAFVRRNFLQCLSRRPSRPHDALRGQSARRLPSAQEVARH